MNADISAQRTAAGRLDAAQLVGLTPNELWSIPSADIQGLQLAGLRARFDQLVTRIPALGRLASEQKIERISRLDDAAPLLFRHNVYKSYPLSFLEKSDFTRLTRWLDGLTAFDLSKLDPSKCESIDEWIQFLDSNTEIRVIHSSGTSGKLSFLPRSEGEFAQLHLKWQHHFFEGFGAEGEHVVEGIEGLPVITPSYRFGALGQQRMIEHIAKYWHRGRAVPVIALHPTRMSADALSLGGRLLAAEAKGELGRLQLSPKLLARRDEFLAESKDLPARMEKFLDAIARLQGERVILLGLAGQYYDLAVAGNKRGMNHMFAADSLISMGGGNKNRALAEGWEKMLFDFLGRPVRDAYGMSEIMAGTRKCPQGNYHIQPWVILYLVDHASGQVLPRTGTQTGRLGVFDLLPSTYWGGFLTGDEITITFDEAARCGCGRIGPYLHANLRRYSEQEGGDDKITCAGAPQAHDNAVQYLIDLAG
jgi:hypothetical protein